MARETAFGTGRKWHTAHARKLWQEATRLEKDAPREDPQARILAANALAEAAWAYQEAMSFAKAADLWSRVERRANLLRRDETFFEEAERLSDERRYAIACMEYLDGAYGEAIAALAGSRVTERTELLIALCTLCLNNSSGDAVVLLNDICADADRYACREGVGEGRYSEQRIFADAVGRLSGLFACAAPDELERAFCLSLPDPAHHAKRLRLLADRALTHPHARACFDLPPSE